MATVLSIALLNHQVGISLIRETRVALGQDDRAFACQLLRDFAGHTACYNQAGTDIMYPRFALLESGDQYRLVTLYRQQTAIATQTSSALDGLAAGEAFACRIELGRLHTLLSDHWAEEQPVLKTLACQGDEQLVQKLAATLRQCRPLFALASTEGR